MESGSSGLITTVGIFNITSLPIANSNYTMKCVGENPYGKVEQSTTLEVYCKCKLLCTLSFLLRFHFERSSFGPKSIPQSHVAALYSHDYHLN